MPDIYAGTGWPSRGAETAEVGFANPMTTAGDTIIGGASGVAERQAKVMTTAGDTIIGGASGVPTRQAKVMTAAGDIIIGGASGVQTRLAKGSDDQVLKLVSGAPAWAAEATDVGFANPMTTAGDLIGGGASGVAARLAGPGAGTFALQSIDGVLTWVAVV